MSLRQYLFDMETTRLIGRHLVEGDLRFVASVWNDGRVAPTIGGTRDDDQLIDRIGLWTRHWAAHGFGATMFHERTTTKPVAWGGLQISTIGIGECLTVGYVVSPASWGLGYATEIATASTAHAFEVLEADELHASVLDTNRASRRVLEKAGLSMKREIDHGTHIEVVYSIARRAGRGA